MSDSTEPILEQLKKQEVYLKSLATDQAQLLEISKKRLNTERYKVILMGAKFLFFVFLTWISIVFLQNMTEDLLRSFTGLGGQGQSAEVSGTQDLNQTLQNSQELMREIMGR